MVFTKVSEKVYTIIGPPAYANITAFLLPGQAVLADCGLQLPAVTEVKRALEVISNVQIRTVILTHFHSDHTRALPAFADCRIISSPSMLTNLRLSGRKPPEGYQLTLPNEVFADRLEIQDGDARIIVKHTGGHTDGSTYIYSPEHGVVAAGDNLWINYYPWGGAKNGDPDLWIQALEEYLSLNVEHFIPGHGPVGTKENVLELLTYIKNVREAMIEAIALGKSEEEVIRAGDEVEYYTSGIAKSSTLRKWQKIWCERAEIM
ncbi:MAG: MBL fold metallo-hydrolase [Candidatus Bathyarchaeota archaeon]|nr:MAG: MBL fold metallo-hydrolase [Candidatus Bathyarchaeota archaeon]